MIRIDCKKKYLGSCRKGRLQKNQVIGRETSKKATETTVRNDDRLI